MDKQEATSVRCRRKQEGSGRPARGSNPGPNKYVASGAPTEFPDT
jgi:hypothetical protein